MRLVCEQSSEGPNTLNNGPGDSRFTFIFNLRWRYIRIAGERCVCLLSLLRMKYQRIGMKRIALKGIAAVCALFLAGPGLRGGVPAQSAVTMAQVKKVCVGSLGNKQGASELREKLIERLRKSHDVQVVESASDADAVISGSGEIWVKGHYLASPRSSRYGEVAIYGGALSVELKGKGDETLWSYLVTPSKFHWGTVAEDLADQVTKKLVEAVQKSVNEGAVHK